MEKDYDFVVIGGGSAGYAAASTAARAGLSVAVIEGGKEVGGLCILRGCMPSKALLATAARAAAVRSANELGVSAGFKGVDGVAMQKRKRLLIEDFAGYRRSQLESGRFTFVRGTARFIDPHSLEIRGAIDDLVLTGKTFLIATGSRIQSPQIEGLSEVGFLDSDAMLEQECLPGSVTVLGGGAIALEAASFYAGIGAKVVLLQRSQRVLKDLDEDVSVAVADGLRHGGVRVETGVQIRGVRSGPLGKGVSFFRGDQSDEVVSEEIMCAMGRVPETRGLGLDVIGIGREGERLQVDSTQQTALPHIFGAGDVCGPLEVVHVAIQQGEIAARNAVRLVGRSNEALERMDYRLKLFAVFSEPGVASVGLTEAEASGQGLSVLTSSHPFADHGKSMVENHLQGFVKLIVEATSRRIVGGSVVGPNAAELIHEVVTAMHFNATAGDLARIPHYHPTLSEIWTYPAEDLA